MTVAITRAVSPNITACELTHLEREPIDRGRALTQHRQYEDVLESLGCSIRRTPELPEMPDAVFVEDIGLVLPELAVVTRPGAESRRAEVDTIASILARFRPVASIDAPGTLDGGDVLRIGSRIFVGTSGRSNEEGVRQLAELTSPFGYEVTSIEVTGCLHLKTAVTEITDGTLLLNPAWVDAGDFAGYELIEVHPSEPFAANALRIGDGVVYPAHHPRTLERLEDLAAVHTVEADELAKAEAGVTCCSIIIEQEAH